jgi:ribosomal peptide maturation radical SAM protein 1
MQPRVALVSMPWTSFSDPSLGLAILKSQLRNEGIESRVFHHHLSLLRYVTDATYQRVSTRWAVNEFVFTGALDESFSDDQINSVVERSGGAVDAFDPEFAQLDPRKFSQTLIRLRHEVAPRYLADCAEEILEYRPTLVGFTCMFDQTMASAALARLLREQLPDVPIVFGGYAVEGPPGREVLKAFPFVNAIAEGDGEPIIGALGRASVGDGELDQIPGIVTRTHDNSSCRAKFELDNSPTPDYDDWFADLERLRERDRVTVYTTLLPIESSRGCWWGQKHHCVFCGIDENTLNYRMKKPETVLAQLKELRSKYGNDIPFRFSDYILPQTYMTGLLPALEAIEPRYELQCEIKANQSDAKIAALARAGFSELQPGIESFSSQVLSLMKKGVRAITNVGTIKQSYVHGVVIHYNVIWGIPGEEPEWYRRMLAQMPRLYHLPPPISRTEAIVTRYAPLQAHPARYSLSARPRHHHCYDALFSAEFLARTGFALDQYAYYFDRYYPHSQELDELYGLLALEVNHWKGIQRQRDVFLTWEATEDGLRIRDSRFGTVDENSLDGWMSSVYLACDRDPTDISAIARELDIARGDVERAVNRLDDLRLVWREGNEVLGLAVPAHVHADHEASHWKRNWIGILC